MKLGKFYVKNLKDIWIQKIKISELIREPFNALALNEKYKLALPLKKFHFKNTLWYICLKSFIKKY